MAGTKGLSLDGLTLDTWNVGRTFIELNSLSRTATGLTTFWIFKGQMTLGASFLDSTHRGRSWVDNHTLWPTWWERAVLR